MGILDGKDSNSLREICACIKSVRDYAENRGIFDEGQYPIVISPLEGEKFKVYTGDSMKSEIESKMLSLLFFWMDSIGKPVRSIEIWSRVVFYDFRMIKDLVHIVLLHTPKYGKSVLVVRPIMYQMKKSYKVFDVISRYEVWDDILERSTVGMERPFNPWYGNVIGSHSTGLRIEGISPFSQYNVTWLHMVGDVPAVSILAFNGDTFCDYLYKSGNPTCDLFIEDIIGGIEKSEWRDKGISSVYILGRGKEWSVLREGKGGPMVVIF